MPDRPNVFRSTDFRRRDTRRFPQSIIISRSAVGAPFFGASTGAVYLYINPKYFGYKFGMLPLAAGRRFRYNER